MKPNVFDQLRKIVCILTGEVDADHSANAVRFNTPQLIRGKRFT